MNILKKKIILHKEEYYKKHLSIVNAILPVQMTPTELEVLAAFLALEGDLSKDPFSTTGRKMVKEKLKMTAGGLGNHLKELKNKKFILTENKKYKILPLLVPDNLQQFYQLKLEKNHDV